MSNGTKAFVVATLMAVAAISGSQGQARGSATGAAPALLPE